MAGCPANGNSHVNETGLPRKPWPMVETLTLEMSKAFTVNGLPWIGMSAYCMTAWWSPDHYKHSQSLISPHPQVMVINSKLGESHINLYQIRKP